MFSVPVPGFSFSSPLVALPVSCFLCPSEFWASSWTAENGWQGPAPRRSRCAASHISKHQPQRLTSGGTQLVLQLLSEQNYSVIATVSIYWARLASERRLNRLTVSVVVMDITLWNMALQPEGCLLSMGSLREDSLWDTDMHSLLVAWDRKCRQGTLDASVSLLKITSCLQFTYLIFLAWNRWRGDRLPSPIFGMNDCIDERVVDGWGLGDDSGDGFGIRIQDASISGREQKCTPSSFPADSFWISAKFAGCVLLHHSDVVNLPSPGDERDTCVGWPGQHKHYNNHKSNLGQLPLSLDRLLLNDGRLPHLRAQLFNISEGEKGGKKINPTSVSRA